VRQEQLELLGLMELLVQQVLMELLVQQVLME
jgi:hypothetical protein